MENDLEEFEVVCQKWTGVDKRGIKYCGGWTIHLMDNDRKLYIKNIRKNTINQICNAIFALRKQIVFTCRNLKGPYDGLFLNKLYKQYN